MHSASLFIQSYGFDANTGDLASLASLTFRWPQPFTALSILTSVFCVYNFKSILKLGINPVFFIECLKNCKPFFRGKLSNAWVWASEVAKLANLKLILVTGCAKIAPFILSKFKTFLQRKESTRESNLEFKQNSTITLSSYSQSPFTAQDPITEKDLAELIWRVVIDGGDKSNPNWKTIVERSSDSMAYLAMRRDSNTGSPCEYLSSTRYKNCSSRTLRNFFLDLNYTLKWDSILKKVQKINLSSNPKSDCESAVLIKHYPITIKPIAYILAWRTWKGERAGEYFCVTKAVRDVATERSLHCKTVDSYVSMWRIWQVDSTTAQIDSYVQDSYSNSRIAKFGFRKTIWSYLENSENYLRQYINVTDNDRLTPGGFQSSKFPEFIANELSNNGSKDAIHGCEYLKRIRELVQAPKQTTNITTTQTKNTVLAPNVFKLSRGQVFLAGVCGLLLVTQRLPFGRKILMACAIQTAREAKNKVQF